MCLDGCVWWQFRHERQAVVVEGARLVLTVQAIIPGYKLFQCTIFDEWRILGIMHACAISLSAVVHMR